MLSGPRKYFPYDSIGHYRIYSIKYFLGPATVPGGRDREGGVVRPVVVAVDGEPARVAGRAAAKRRVASLARVEAEGQRTCRRPPPPHHPQQT
jgi:hypothetical protein